MSDQITHTGALRYQQDVVRFGNALTDRIRGYEMPDMITDIRDSYYQSIVEQVPVFDPRTDSVYAIEDVATSNLIDLTQHAYARIELLLGRTLAGKPTPETLRESVQRHLSYGHADLVGARLSEVDPYSAKSIVNPLELTYLSLCKTAELRSKLWRSMPRVEKATRLAKFILNVAW